MRAQSAKKASLQQRADQARAMHKSLLEELKAVAESIENAQRELEAVSKDYGALLPSQPVEEVGNRKAHGPNEMQSMEVEPIRDDRSHFDTGATVPGGGQMGGAAEKEAQVGRCG